MEWGRVGQSGVESSGTPSDSKTKTIENAMEY